jgi:hypothetical protein
LCEVFIIVRYISQRVVEACSKTRSSTIEQPNLTIVVTTEERKVFLNSLSFRQIDARLLNIRKAHDRTCNWLFKQPEYKQWLNYDLTDNHHGFL